MSELAHMKIAGQAERDVRVPDKAFAIETYLGSLMTHDPDVITSLRGHLMAGRLVVIRDAFESAFANQGHRSLDAVRDWQVHENYDGQFPYHHHNLYGKKGYPALLVWCDRVSSSPTTKAFATKLSGRDCWGPTTFPASWYLPGDYSLPHDDAVETESGGFRQVAFVCGTSPRTGVTSGVAHSSGVRAICTLCRCLTR